MSYIIISRDQLDKKLHTELCNDEVNALKRRHTLINAYSDVVVLSIEECKNLIDPIWNGPKEDLIPDVKIKRRAQMFQHIQNLNKQGSPRRSVYPSTRDIKKEMMEVTCGEFEDWFNNLNEEETQIYKAQMKILQHKK